MLATKALTIISLSSVVLLGGCVAVNPRESFPEVERTVAEATSYRVHWNDGSDADKAVAAQVDALLAKSLDAEAAVQIALLNNRNLQAVYENIGIAQAELVAAGLLTNPVFDGSVRFLEAGGSPTIDFGIAFEFLDVFFIGARKRLAEAQLEGVKADVTSAVLQTAGDVKIAFYEAQEAEQNVELRRQVEQATSASYDLARRLREAGNNTPLDLAYERALYEEARLSLATAEADSQLAHENLNRLMGVWGSKTEWTVAGRLPNLPVEGEPAADTLEKRAIENSLALKGTRAQITAAAREVGIALPLGYLSELEVGASAERDDGEWEVGPAVSLPIPLFSQGQPAVARFQAALRQAEQRYFATAVEIRANIRAAFVRVQSLRQRVEYFQKVILPLRQSIVEETQLQYNAMQIGAFQLLQAKRDQVDAAGTYLSLLRDYWVAKTELELGLRGRSLEASRPMGGNSSQMPTGSGSAGGH